MRKGTAHRAPTTTGTTAGYRIQQAGSMLIS